METTDTQPQPQQTSVRPRLERLRRGRAIAGVAAGLARYLGVDVAWVRVGFVVAALFGGSGILLYLIGWLAIPEEGEEESIAVDRAGGLEGAGRWVGIGLIVLAAMIILGNSGLIAGELLFAGVLVAAGVLLYRGDLGGGRTQAPDVAAPFAPEEPLASPLETTVAEETKSDEPPWVSEMSEPSYVAPPKAPPPSPDPAFQPRPVVPRESSPLGRFTMAAVLIVIGVMGIGHSAGWFEPALRQYAAAVFVTLGIGLLVSSLFGRARWLIVLGVILSPLLLGVALLKVPFEGGFGDPRHAPSNIAEVESEYRLMAGQMVLDLSDVDVVEGEPLDVEASVVFGRLEVIVPAGVTVNAVAKVDAGEIFIDGVRQSQIGPGPSDNVDMERIISYAGSGQLTLEAHVGFGELSVKQEVVEVAP